MKLKVNRSNLAEALNLVGRAVASKHNIPILSNIYLSAQSNKLILKSTNLEVGITTWLPAKIETKGEVTVSGKVFADYVNSLSDEHIELELVGNVLSVDSSSSKASLQIIPAADFPPLPAKTEAKITFVAKDFAAAIDRVSVAASTDNIGRIQYTGVLLEINEDSVTLVATNGYRLAVDKVTASKFGEFKSDLIIPARNLSELVRIMTSHKEKEVEMFLSENHSQVIFVIGQTEFSSRLLEGPYPEYKRIIPEETTFNFSFSKAEIEKAFRTAQIFARNTAGSIVDLKLDIESKSLEIVAEAYDVGKNTQKIELLSVESPTDINVGFNLLFLLDCLDRLPSGDVSFGIKSSLAPALFTSPDLLDYKHIIMSIDRG